MLSMRQGYAREGASIVRTSREQLSERVCRRSSQGESRCLAPGPVPQTACALADFGRGGVDATPGGDGEVLRVAGRIERAHPRVLQPAGNAHGVGPPAAWLRRQLTPGDVPHRPEAADERDAAGPQPDRQLVRGPDDVVARGVVDEPGEERREDEGCREAALERAQGLGRW